MGKSIFTDDDTNKSIQSTVDTNYKRISAITGAFQLGTLPREQYKQAVGSLQYAVEQLDTVFTDIEGSIASADDFASIVSDGLASTVISNVANMQATAKLCASAMMNDLAEDMSLEEALVVPEVTDDEVVTQDIDDTTEAEDVEVRAEEENSEETTTTTDVDKGAETNLSEEEETTPTDKDDSEETTEPNPADEIKPNPPVDEETTTDELANTEENDGADTTVNPLTQSTQSNTTLQDRVSNLLLNSIR